mmetsp:Transcript_33347/g.84389  ORF Transcript_33347/g.84389 Transcript_33347/m.84389 type:complete len:296 (+) Transcript_33347:3187-4074(+)
MEQALTRAPRQLVNGAIRGGDHWKHLPVVLGLGQACEGGTTPLHDAAGSGATSEHALAGVEVDRCDLVARKGISVVHTLQAHDVALIVREIPKVHDALVAAAREEARAGPDPLELLGLWAARQLLLGLVDDLPLCVEAKLDEDRTPGDDHHHVPLVEVFQHHQGASDLVPFGAEAKVIGQVDDTKLAAEEEGWIVQAGLSRRRHGAEDDLVVGSTLSVVAHLAQHAFLVGLPNANNAVGIRGDTARPLRVEGDAEDLRVPVDLPVLPRATALRPGEGDHAVLPSCRKHLGDRVPS